MPAVVFKFNGNGLADILLGDKMGNEMLRRAENVADRAKSLAPVETGAYRNSLRATRAKHPTRQVAHALSDVDYALDVEAAHRVLGHAIDAAKD